MALTKSERTQLWRKRNKQRLIQAFGGACGCCGYFQCSEVFEFHHLDPTQKETSWGYLNRLGGGSWEKLRTEMSKCIMVCSNCHKEIHAGHRNVPDYVARFNEDLITIKIGKDLKLR